MGGKTLVEAEKKKQLQLATTRKCPLALVTTNTDQPTRRVHIAILVLKPSKVCHNPRPCYTIEGHHDFSEVPQFRRFKTRRSYNLKTDSEKN